MFWCRFSPLSIRNYNEEPRLSTSNENRYFRGTSDEIPNLWLIASKRCLARISSFDFGDVRSVFLEDRGLDPGICSCNIKWDCPCYQEVIKWIMTFITIIRFFPFSKAFKISKLCLPVITEAPFSLKLSIYVYESFFNMHLLWGNCDFVSIVCTEIVTKVFI